LKRVEGAGVDILGAHQASRATQLLDQEDFPVVGDVAGEDVDREPPGLLQAEDGERRC
jgi:hypothetical protein